MLHLSWKCGDVQLELWYGRLYPVFLVVYFFLSLIWLVLHCFYGFIPLFKLSNSEINVFNLLNNEINQFLCLLGLGQFQNLRLLHHSELLQTHFTFIVFSIFLKWGVISYCLTVPICGCWWTINDLTRLSSKWFHNWFINNIFQI